MTGTPYMCVEEYKTCSPWVLFRVPPMERAATPGCSIGCRFMIELSPLILAHALTLDVITAGRAFW